MEELLNKLGIKATEDFEIIQEKLEQKQIEYLQRLDAVEDENRSKQLKETLTEIEMALAHVSWMLEKIGKGLVVEGSDDSGEAEVETEERKDFTSLKGKGQENNLGMKALSSVLGNTPPPSGQTTSVSPKLQRAFICLEGNDWDKADSLLEDVLNEDPTDSKAYVGKFMAELHIAKEDKIREYSSPIKNNNYFKLALKYASADYAKILQGYSEYIENTIAYKAALKAMLNANSEQEYDKVADLFDKLGNFQDASSKATDCRRISDKKKQAVLQSKLDEKEKLYQQAVSDMKKQEYHDILSAIRKFRSSELSSYKDVPQLLRQCEKELTELKYTMAVDKMNSINQIDNAIELFTELGDYKDSKKKKEESEARRTMLLQKEKKSERAKKTKSGLIKIIVIGVIAALLIELKQICLYTGIDADGTLQTYRWFVGKELVIPQSVFDKEITSIGDNVFEYKNKLSSVTIPEGVQTIGEYAFYGSGVSKLTLPESLVSIGEGAFSGCSLTEITFPEGLTSIGGYADNNLTKVILPEGITNIEDRAFYGNDLTEILIPEGVTKIGDGAFENCDKLTLITLPDSLTEIGSSAFAGCSSLSNIEIPEGVIRIGAKAFKDISGLTEISLPDNLKELGDEAFVGCSLSEITVPAGVALGQGVFKNSATLTKATLLEGITSIGQEAFNNCDNLSEVTIHESKDLVIGRLAFEGCDNLSKVTLSEGITFIQVDAFANCNSLTEIILPEGVESMWGNPFYGCYNLAKITLPRSMDSFTAKHDRYFNSHTQIYVYRDSIAAEYFAEDPRIVYID